MSRIYKKSNFAGTNASTGIAFGGGGGDNPNHYSNSKSTIDVARDREREHDNESKSFTQVVKEGVSDYVKDVNNNIVKGGYEAITGTSAGADDFSKAFFDGSDTDKRFDNDVDKIFGTGEYAK